MGDQPRGRLLRRGARAPVRTNPNAMATLWGKPMFTNTALTPEGDTWWEGMTADPPPELMDWLGESWTPDSGRARRTPERALHRARRAVPVDRARVGGSRGRADLGDPLRRPPRGHRAAGRTRRARGSTACSWARRWPPRRRPPRPAPWANCAATRSRCCPSAATTWATTSPTGSRSARGGPGEAAAHLPGQLVPQDARTAATCGPASARTAACWPGSPSAAKAPPARSRRPSGSCPRRVLCRSTGSTLADGDLEALLAVDVDGWEAELPRLAEHLATFGDRLPGELEAQLDDLRARLGSA